MPIPAVRAGWYAKSENERRLADGRFESQEAPET